MSAPLVDWPPEEVLDGMGDYLEALERLVRHVVAIRERFGPLIARYSAWANAEPRQDGWLQMAEIITGMDRAADLAGAMVRIGEETLVPGGASWLTDDRFAELVHAATSKGDHP